MEKNASNLGPFFFEPSPELFELIESIPPRFLNLPAVKPFLCEGNFLNAVRTVTVNMNFLERSQVLEELYDRIAQAALTRYRGKSPIVFTSPSASSVSSSGSFPSPSTTVGSWCSY